jgi:16S rRNA A1518/A1519 N6-dimethyltransferase RsmA/KsgA/DIM1 with predicted DNA glycosylase/AP lyase activity
MLRLAKVRKDEVLYDLGAGDGRILVEAVRGFGAQAVGVEIDPDRVLRIKERLKSTGVDAVVIQGDLMEVDLSAANVVTMYLSDSVNARLAPKLRRELNPGTRVVSLDYALPGWLPDKEVRVKGGGLERTVFLYEVQQ